MPEETSTGNRSGESIPCAHAYSIPNVKLLTSKLLLLLKIKCFRGSVINKREFPFLERVSLTINCDQLLQLIRLFIIRYVGV